MTGVLIGKSVELDYYWKGLKNIVLLGKSLETEVRIGKSVVIEVLLKRVCFLEYFLE